jgi:hypothetical protein
MATVAGILVVETAALHLLLVRWVPIVAWLLTAASVSALAWLLRDDRALRRPDAVRVDATHLHLDVGRRVRAAIPRSEVGEVLMPTWRDLAAAVPRPLNATKPASPNVLVFLKSPQRIRVLGVVERAVERIALHVDEPERLVALLSGQS